MTDGTPRAGDTAHVKHPWRPLERACRMLVAALRQCCPELRPTEPLVAGATAAPVLVPPKAASTLIVVAVRQAVLSATGSNMSAGRLPESVLWQEADNALLVEVAGIVVELGEGIVSVSLPVRCGELPESRGLVVVDFVVGTPERPTGMLAAATEPRGPRAVVRRWGDALTALAWQALLDAAGGVAAAVGVDHDGAPLVPTALACSRDGLSVLPQARHEIDRIRPGQVVLAAGPP
jgi:hypothetical protein